MDPATQIKDESDLDKKIQAVLQRLNRFFLHACIAVYWINGLFFLDCVLDAQNYYAGEIPKLTQANRFHLPASVCPSEIFLLNASFHLALAILYFIIQKQFAKRLDKQGVKNA